jgi:hypothetical protein
MHVACELTRALHCHIGIWILKPSDLSKGLGVTLIPDLRQWVHAGELGAVVPVMAYPLG